MSEASSYGIVSSAFANRDDARRVAGALLAEKLAACVQLTPSGEYMATYPLPFFVSRRYIGF